MGPRTIYDVACLTFDHLLLCMQALPKGAKAQVERTEARWKVRIETDARKPYLEDTLSMKAIGWVVFVG